MFAPSDVYTVRNLDEKKATVLLRGAVTATLDPASKAIDGPKNNPLQALAWLREYTAPNGAKGQAFCTTMGAAADLVSHDALRLVVNAAYHLTGLEVPKAANVDFVDPFYPSFYGFVNKQFWIDRNLKPQDFALGKSPLPKDPPGTPAWPFRKSGPAE